MPAKSQHVIHASVAADSTRLTPTAMKQADCAVRPIMKAMLGGIIHLRTGRASCTAGRCARASVAVKSLYMGSRQVRQCTQPASTLWADVVITPALGRQVQQQHPTAPGMVCGLVQGHMPQLPQALRAACAQVLVLCGRPGLCIDQVLKGGWLL